MREDEFVLRWTDPHCGGCEYQHHVPLLVEGSDLTDEQHFNFLLRGDRGIEHVCHRFMKGLLQPIAIPIVTVPEAGVAIDIEVFKATLLDILQLETVTEGPGLCGFKYAPIDFYWNLNIGKLLGPSMLLRHLLHFRRVVVPKLPIASLREATSSQNSDQSLSMPSSSPVSSRVVEEATCSLCMEIMLEPVTLKCGHSGCLECMQLARLDTICCPVCRSEHPGSITVSISLRNLIESLFEHDLSFRLRRDKDFRRKHEESLRAQATLQFYSQCFDERSRVLDASFDWEEDFRRNLNAAVDSADKFFHPPCFPAPSPGLKSLWMTSEVQEENLDEIDVDILDKSLANLLWSAGCSRIENAPVEDSVLTILKKHIRESLSSTLSHCKLNANSRKSRVITSRDALQALLEKGVIFYGYGIAGYKGLWTKQINFILCQVHTGLVLAPDALSIANDLCTYILLRIVRTIKSRGNMERVYQHYDARASPQCSHLIPYLRLTSSGDSVIFVRDTEELFVEPLMPLDHNLMHGSSIVLMRHVQMANKRLLFGGLNEHAEHEGTKAVEKLKSSSHTQNVGISLDVLSHLVFSPEKVAQFCGREENVVLSDGAAVYLTATVEYLVAELMELAGNAAKESQSDFIEGIHVCRAINNDKEVSEVFLSKTSAFGGYWGVIRGGLFAIHGNAIPQGTASTAFTRMLHTKALRMPYRVIVDPRDGKHYRASAEQGQWTIMPELDAASPIPAPLRRHAAIASLSRAEQILLQRCFREKMETEGMMGSDSRLRRSDLHIPMMVFYPLCRQLISEPADERGVEMRFTAEAIDILQEALEWEILMLTQRALLMTSLDEERSSVLSAEALRLALEINIST